MHEKQNVNTKDTIKKLITVDGPAASGKSSLSRSLADRLGWKWLSTGIFYRGLAFLALYKKVEDEQTIAKLIDTEDWSICLNKEQSKFIYNKEDITLKVYTETVDAFASKLAKFPLVRKTLLPYQRDCFQQNEQGLIAEGRDCGTVVFPDASLKIYLTAEDDIRAMRRAHQRGSLPVNDVITLQKQRDKQDISRENSPLREPIGAFIIDTGTCSFEEMVNKAYKKSCELFNFNLK